MVDQRDQLIMYSLSAPCWEIRALFLFVSSECLALEAFFLWFPQTVRIVS